MLLSYGCYSRKINHKIPHRSKTLTPVSCARPPHNPWVAKGRKYWQCAEAVVEQEDEGLLEGFQVRLFCTFQVQVAGRMRS